MAIQGKQLQLIQAALLDAYDRPSLESMLFIKLDVSLEEVASGTNFSELIFNLIRWADRRGLIIELVQAAAETNPGNAKLRQLAEEVSEWDESDGAASAATDSLPKTLHSTDGNGIDGNGTDGNGTDGNGIDGNGTDGNRTDRNGTDGTGTHNPEPPNDPDKRTIIWFFAVILTFLIGIVVTSIFGREIPASSQYIVYAIIALVVSLAAGLGIGTATASGSANQGPIHYRFQIGGLVAAFLTTFLGLLLGQYFFGTPPLPPAPDPVVTPTPTVTAMTGPFNIGVLPIGERTQDGMITSSDLGRALADRFALELRESMVWSSDIVPHFRDPADLPVALGNNEEDIAFHVAAIAEQHSADLLIYGILQTENDQTRLDIYFYISNRKIRFAEEISGVYRLGSALIHEGNASTNPIVNQELSDELVRRAAATARFSTALGYFTLQRYDEALSEFQAALELVDAEAAASASDQVFASLLHLFMGSTYGQLAHWSDSGIQFEAALDLDSSFARAQLGAAQITFLQARGSCQSGDADVIKIEEAIHELGEANEMRYEALAEIPLKVKLFQGQARVCLGVATMDPALLEEAENQLQDVVDAYESTENERIRYLSARAAAALGLLQWIQAETNNAKDTLEEAEESFETAVAWSSERDVQASSLTNLAFIHLGEARCDTAKEKLAQAADYLAELRADNPNADLTDQEDQIAIAQQEWEKNCD